MFCVNRKGTAGLTHTFSQNEELRLSPPSQGKSAGKSEGVGGDTTGHADIQQSQSSDTQATVYVGFTQTHTKQRGSLENSPTALMRQERSETQGQKMLGTYRKD